MQKGTGTWKRIIAFLTAFLLVFGIAVSSLPLSVTVRAQTTATTTDPVNLRSGPGTSYSVVTTLAQGTTVTVTDTSNSKWYAVKTSGGNTGYISVEYLKLAASENLGTATTTDVLNLRKGAGTSYGIVTTLTEGHKGDDPRKRRAKAGTKVKTSSNKTGYVSVEYLKVDSSNSEIGNTSEPEKNLGTATTTDVLNLRKGAGTSYGIVTTLAKGTKVTILEKTSKTWYKVKTSSNKTGYVSVEYLKVDSNNSSSGNTSEPEKNLGTATTTDVLNLRKGAGTSYGIVTTLAKGTKVTILEKTSKKLVQGQDLEQQDRVACKVSVEYLKVGEHTILLCPEIHQAGRKKDRRQQRMS